MDYRVETQDYRVEAQNRLPMERVLYEVKKVIVGQDHLLERLVVALLARGHILVEGVPGLAKTMAIKTLAEAIGGEFKRIQFTPDLVPADLVGTRIYNQKTGDFNTSLGPVFANLLLADEINRAPAKVQSALLEVMQERQVTIGRETHNVPNPFLVLATQNPIETEGTYPLPEAQVDRFMLKVLVDYPSATEEFVIVERMIAPLQAVQKVLTTEQLVELQKAADAVYVDPALIQYATQLVGATRAPQSVGLKELQHYVTFGASPRASINLILAGRALAFVRGRGYVLPQDVLDMAFDVLRHRLVLSYEALSDNVSSDYLLNKIVERIPLPVVPLHEHTKSAPQTSAPTPERILQRLDWQVIRRLDGQLQGDYRSLFYGYGVDFADLREYQPEDDTRYIDWNVTARMDTPYVRKYTEDREIAAWFLLDLSPSMDFGTVGSMKRTVLVDLVATLARLLTRHGNRVGAIFYGNKVERTIPAQGGRVQVLRIINDLLRQPQLPKSPFTDLSPLIGAALHGIKRRSLVFVVSDFISAPGWERPLSLLNRRHEVLGVRVWDPREIELPDVGPVIMEDAETGERLYVDTHDRGFRKRFAEAARQREFALSETLKRAGVDTLSLSTEEDMVRALVRFAALREQHRR